MMKRQVIFILLIIGSVLALLGYHFVERPSRDVKAKTIVLQPLGNFSESLTNSVCSRLKQEITPQVIIASPIALPQSAYNQSKRVYRADSLLNYLSQRYTDENTIVIGLTNRDLTTYRANLSDCRVLGLARTSGNAAVVSTFRLTRRNSDSRQYREQFSKLTIHEFGHTLGLQHCYNDLTCYMGDALSGASLDKFREFCPECTSYLEEHSWIFD